MNPHHILIPGLDGKGGVIIPRPTTTHLRLKQDPGHDVSVPLCQST